MDDAALVARARQGDPAAFGELVDRHRMAVYRAALAALGSPADAEDAAQDAFLAAYRRLDSFRGDARFKTWLLTIAWHEAINRRRGLTRMWRMFRESRSFDEGHEGANDVTSGFSRAVEQNPEQQVAGDEFRRAIREAIRALSPKLRDALLLAQSGEHSYQDIGAMLNAPVGTVKWRVSEARRMVRQRLRERGYGDVAERR